jgi:hypothetical protein
MAQYSPLVGKRVEVQYRAGDIYLPATAVLVADSGKSIFLEERLVQKGVVQAFRWEIPYPSIVRIRELASTATQTSADEKLRPSRPDPLFGLNHRTEES